MTRQVGISCAESKSGALPVEWGFSDSPFGLCSIGWNRGGVCHLGFYDTPGRFSDRVPQDWLHADLSRSDPAASEYAERIFHGRGPLMVFVSGTAFQLRVWCALLKIPEGEVSTYSRIAVAIGSPKACRAVGAACGANPVAYLIPCHRVVHENGSVAGYRWGAERKKGMLALERLARGPLAQVGDPRNTA